LKPILKRLSLYFSIHWTVRCFQTRWTHFSNDKL
jgi:hypothetical protein